MTGKLVAGAVGVAATSVIQPTRWSAFGYSAEAGSLCAGVLLCVAVRFWVGSRNKTHLFIDIPVSAVTVVFTVIAIILQNANLMLAAIIGTGFAAMGEGLISRAKKIAEAIIGEHGGNSGG